MVWMRRNAALSTKIPIIEVVSSTICRFAPVTVGSRAPPHRGRGRHRRRTDLACRSSGIAANSRLSRDNARSASENLRHRDSWVLGGPPTYTNTTSSSAPGATSPLAMSPSTTAAIPPPVCRPVNSSSTADSGDRRLGDVGQCLPGLDRRKVAAHCVHADLEDLVVGPVAYGLDRVLDALDRNFGDLLQHLGDAELVRLEPSHAAWWNCPVVLTERLRLPKPQARQPSPSRRPPDGDGVSPHGQSSRCARTGR